MLKVKSSLIKNYSYYKEKQTLALRFASGKVYVYNNVSIQDLYAFLESDSKGAYFNMHIRGKKPFQDITPLLKKAGK
jgi:hypothetical protein